MQTRLLQILLFSGKSVQLHCLSLLRCDMCSLSMPLAFWHIHLQTDSTSVSLSEMKRTSSAYAYIFRPSFLESPSLHRLERTKITQMASTKRKLDTAPETGESCKRLRVHTYGLSGGGKKLNSTTKPSKNVPPKVPKGSKKGSVVPKPGKGNKSPSAAPSTPTTSVPPVQPDTPTSVGSPFQERPPGIDDLFRRTIERPALFSRQEPVGLAQRGDRNLCYRNAALTLLLYSDHFRRYVRNWHMPQEYNSTSAPAKVKNDQCWLLKELDTIIQSANSALAQAGKQTNNAMFDLWKIIGFPGRSSRTKPWKFDHTWSASTSQPTRGKQEDSGDLLSWLIAEIHLQLGGGLEPEELQTAGLSSTWSERYRWLLQQRRVTRSVCLKCKNVVARRKPTVLPEWKMMLQVPRGLRKKAQPFNDLLSANLQEKREMRCPRCKQTSEIDMIDKFQHAPAIMLFQIIRYTEEEKKITTEYALPDTLDLAPYLDPQQFGKGSKLPYKLAGVVSHDSFGLQNINSGHYISYVRGGQTRSQWFELNDDTVKACSTSNFHEIKLNKKKTTEKTPYVVLYERDFANEKILPGRIACHVDEGKDSDEPASPEKPPLGPPPKSPEIQKGSDSPTHPPKPPKKPQGEGDTPVDNGAEAEKDSRIVVDGQAADKAAGKPEAELNIDLVLGGLDLSIPVIIKNFDSSKDRKVKLKATLTTFAEDTGETEDKIVDLTEIIKYDILNHEKQQKVDKAKTDAFEQLPEDRETWPAKNVTAAINANKEVNRRQKKLTAWRKKHRKTYKQGWRPYHGQRRAVKKVGKKTDPKGKDKTEASKKTGK